MDATELDLLHTVTPMPTAQVEPIPPIDTLLEDIMTGLHLLPPEENQTNQHGIMSTTTSNDSPISMSVYPNSHSVKFTEPKQHLEGELNDILDHFLKTFDQQVGCCSLHVGDETSQDKTDARTEKSDPSTNPCRNTPKTSAHLRHQKTQADFLHTSSTRSAHPQLLSILSQPVAEKTSTQDRQIRGSKVEKPSTNQNLVQQFENRRMTRSQSMKSKLELALISLQNPAKRKCNEKQKAGNKKKRQRNDQERFEACATKSGANNLDKNNKNRAKQLGSEERQKQASARKRKPAGNTSGRKKKSTESQEMAGFYEKKSSHEIRPGINSCGEMMKNVRDHIEAEGQKMLLSNGFQAGQSSVKSQTGDACIEIASSAMEKVRMLFQLQDDEEDERANESAGTHSVNKVENGRLLNHKSVPGAEERLPVENNLQGRPGEIQELENVRRVIVDRVFEGQGKIRNVVEVSQRQEDDERMASGLRQEEMMTKEGREPAQMNLPSNAGKRNYHRTNLECSSKVSRTASVLIENG